MIVDVEKYVIYGAREEMEKFFELAQRSGFLEFIGIGHKKALEMPMHIKNIFSAIKILRKWVGAESGLSLPMPADAVTLAEKVVHLNLALERLFEEVRVLEAEIARVAPFGDFSMSDVKSLEREGRRILQFFCMKSDIAHGLPLPAEVIYVGTDYDLDYFVAINKERVHYPKMIEIQIDRPVGQLREHLQETRVQIAVFEAELRSWAAHLPFLQESLIHCLNEHHLQSAKHDVQYPLGESLFVTEAWVPVSRIKGLKGLLSGLTVSAEPIAIESFDRRPTYMENKKAGKIGEDLVQIYDTPATTDKDPSYWVLVFFSIFFAMIISDAGYGLIYLAIALVLKWKLKSASGAIRRFLKLMFILAFSCIAWGILTASFLGMEIGPNSRFRHTSILYMLAEKKAAYHLEKKDDTYRELAAEFPAVETATNGHEFLELAASKSHGKESYTALTQFTRSFLMEISLLVGIFHLSLSFLRNVRRHVAGLGWCLFMFGGYFYFPTYMHLTTIVNFMGWISQPLAALLGIQLMCIGVGFAIVSSFFQRGFLAGLKEPMTAVQIFSDVLSYLRLYALGLAGIIMASTFNGLGSDYGLAIGACIALFGHIMNIAMSTMVGVIHGLRLNFLEWYHYSFEGGGKRFNPLRLLRGKN